MREMNGKNTGSREEADRPEKAEKTLEGVTG